MIMMGGMAIKGMALVGSVALLAGFSSGFWLKTTMVKADEKKQQEKLLEDFGEYAEGVVQKMHLEWSEKAVEVSDLLTEAAMQRQDDAQLERAALGAIREVKNEIKGISAQIRLVESVGACRLDMEFIRLRNEATDAANAGRSAGDHPDP